MKKQTILHSLLAAGLVVGVATSVLAQEARNEETNFNPDAVEVDDAGSTMGDDYIVPDDAEVEYTVNQLQQIINFPAGALTKEYQENLEQPKVIFEDADIERIFGINPVFIYYPEGQDPMIIPWVRERVVAQELMDEAMVAKSIRDFDKAKSILRQIQEEYPSTGPGQRATEEISNIDSGIAAEAKALRDKLDREKEVANRALPDPNGNIEIPGPGEEPVVLPDWVANNTTGVMIKESGENVVIIQNDFIDIGGSVPRYPQVKVKEVTDSKVIYTFQNKEFELRIDGAF